MDTVEHAELVEEERGAFIERRSRKGAVDPDGESELWRGEGVRRYNARRQEENRLAWCNDFELRAGGVGSCVLRFFGFPDFVTGV